MRDGPSWSRLAPLRRYTLICRGTVVTNAARSLLVFRAVLASAVVVCAAFSVDAGLAQSGAPSTFGAMHWREIGPMRAGRTRALAGVASEPATFYFGGV